MLGGGGVRGRVCGVLRFMGFWLGVLAGWLGNCDQLVWVWVVPRRWVLDAPRGHCVCLGRVETPHGGMHSSWCGCLVAGFA